MHLAIRQGVDKINSLQADLLLPEEIELELNKVQGKLINKSYGKNNVYQKGFEESQKRIDDIRSLLRETIVTCTYKEAINLKGKQFYVDTAKLPDEYMFLINSISSISYSATCTNDLVWTMGFPQTLIYYRLPYFEFITNTGNLLVDEISLYENTSDLTTSGVVDIWLNPNSLVFGVDDAATIQADILANGTGAAGVSIFWETGVPGQSLNFPGEFIVVIDLATFAGGWTFNLDPNAILPVTEILGTDTTTPPTSVYSRALPLEVEVPYNEKRTATSNILMTDAPNAFNQQDDIYASLSDPFNTTTHKKPIYTIRDEYLDIYTSDIFLIDEVKILYIKEPAEISLPLQQSCELPNHMHQTLVDMTISSLLEGFSDPRYKSHELEVGKNE